MFTFKAVAIASLMITSSTTAFFAITPLTKMNCSPTSKMAISMMSDTKKKMGKSVIGTTLPSIPNEMEETSPFFHRTPAGTGMDERSPMNLSDETKAMESEKISSIFKSFRQNSLKMVLESKTLGHVEKLHRVSLAATIQGILPESLVPGASKVACMAAGGLFDDWNSSIEY